MKLNAQQHKELDDADAKLRQEEGRDEGFSPTTWKVILIMILVWAAAVLVGFYR